MKTFYEWLFETTVDGNMPRTYDFDKFVSLPWNWKKLEDFKVIFFPYYYGSPTDDDLEDFQFSLLHRKNMREIPSNQLSYKNKKTGNMPSMRTKIEFLKQPQSWYDDKLNGFYDGIKEIGKTPEFFGGTDIRK